MPGTYLTLSPNETFVIGAPDLRFPFNIVNQSNGEVGRIPNPDPEIRQADFFYTFTAGTSGYASFIAVNPAFQEYDPYYIKIVGPDGQAAEQHAPVATADTIRVTIDSDPFSSSSILLKSLLANDPDPDGDYLYLTIVDPITFHVPDGSLTDSTIFSNSPDLADGTYFPLDGTTVSVDAATPDGVSYPYAEATFSYYLTDPYGNTSNTVPVTIQLGTPPGARGTYIHGTDDADRISKSKTDEPWQINGADGDDVLRGGAVRDILNGAAGDDRISGGGGNDLITGGAGADRMRGDAGDDYFLFRAGDFATGAKKDLILDFEGAGQSGGDVIRFFGFDPGAQLVHLGDTGATSEYLVTDGTHSGEFWIRTGGVELAPGDYGFHSV